MDRLEEIFKRQREYLATLGPIYRKNGFPDGSMPFDLNDRHDQEQFRLLAWRITEEVYEALAALKQYNNPEISEDLKTAFTEEMADVLHFLIELALVTGVSEFELITGLEGRVRTAECDEDMLSGLFLTIRETPAFKRIGPDYHSVLLGSLAETMMTFRQRPWRTDNRPTDRGAFVHSLAKTFIVFIISCLQNGLTADSLYEAFFLKAKINDERIKAQL